MYISEHKNLDAHERQAFVGTGHLLFSGIPSDEILADLLELVEECYRSGDAFFNDSPVGIGP